MSANKTHTIELNKRIQSMTNIQELWDLIRSSSAGFNHVNVATALRKVLQLPRHGVSPEVVVKALKTIEESALQKMQVFGTQEIANTWHIMAKHRHKPSQALLMALECRAEELAEEFNTQEVVNSLWAFATMGRTPGERLMGQLEGRAEAISGEFNSQEVANTLWAYATMGRKPGERLMAQLEGRAEAISGEFNSQEVTNTLWAFATIGKIGRAHV